MGSEKTPWDTVHSRKVESSGLEIAPLEFWIATGSGQENSFSQFVVRNGMANISSEVIYKRNNSLLSEITAEESEFIRG